MESEIQRILQEKITLFQYLGVAFKVQTPSRICLQVDLQKNLNHKGTAFGGSLYTTAVLAAYALVLSGLRSRKIQTENIVIAKGSMEYLRPVETDFEAACEFSSSESEKSFFLELISKGRVRQDIQTQIIDSGGSLRAVFVGTFVVKL